MAVVCRIGMSSSVNFKPDLDHFGPRKFTHLPNQPSLGFRILVPTYPMALHEVQTLPGWPICSSAPPPPLGIARCLLLGDRCWKPSGDACGGVGRQTGFPLLSCSSHRARNAGGRPLQRSLWDPLASGPGVARHRIRGHCWVSAPIPHGRLEGGL